MDSTLPIAMIGKSLNHRLFIFERCSTFAQNFKKNDYEDEEIKNNDYSKFIRIKGFAK